MCKQNHNIDEMLGTRTWAERCAHLFLPLSAAKPSSRRTIQFLTISTVLGKPVQQVGGTLRAVDRSLQRRSDAGAPDQRVEAGVLAAHVQGGEGYGFGEKDLQKDWCRSGNHAPDACRSGSAGQSMVRAVGPGRRLPEPT